MILPDLVIATHNQGKAREIAELLKPYVARFYTSQELNLPEPAETGRTFAENALLKARAAVKACGKPSLADDSGLAVTALNGAPGIYSARWAGAEKDFTYAMQKLHDALEGHEDRSAQFVCALALAWPDGRAEVFEGRAEGEIIWPARGALGFGYDPVFTPRGETRTFAEMSSEEKQILSHRADAFRKLIGRFNCHPERPS